MNSPILYGFNNNISTPPAKFWSVPLNAIPIATPADAKIAINDDVSIPSMPITVTISIKYNTILTMLRTKVARDWSTFLLDIMLLTKL